MIFPVFAISVCRFAPAAQQAASIPHHVDARFEFRAQNLVVVPVTVDKIPKHFEIQPQQPCSFWRGERKPSVTLEVGGADVGNILMAELLEGDVDADGALGGDYLWNTAIGIDLINRQLTLWPEGNLSSDEADSWIHKAPKWGEGPCPINHTVLGRAGLVPTIPIEINGQAGSAMLKFGFFCSEMGPSGLDPGGLALSSDQTVHTRIAARLRAGGEEVHWAIYQSVDDVTTLGACSGMSLSLDMFRSRRLIVDFKARCLFREELPPDLDLTFLLTKYLGVY